MSGRPPGKRTRKTSETQEGRETQLVSATMDLAEKQINEGTVSSQVMVHFLKLGTERDRLERQRLQNENLLLSAKVDAMASAKRVEELYGEALAAMRTYSGHDSGSEEEYYE
jgi:hypothetical protein